MSAVDYSAIEEQEAEGTLNIFLVFDVVNTQSLLLSQGQVLA